MRRLWMSVTGLMMIAGCRTEGTDDRMLRTQRQSDHDTATEQQAQAERRQSQTADRGAHAVARVFSMIQAMNQDEIETSKLAQGRAMSPDVKAYAGKLVTEHQLALEAINRLTQSRRIELSAAQDDPFIKARRAAMREKLERLAKLEGPAFDDAYMEGQQSDHAMLSALAREGEDLSKDSDVDACLRMIGEQAQDHRARASALLPKLCARTASAQTGPGEQAGSGPGQSRRRGMPATRSPQSAARPQGAPPAHTR